MISRNDGRPDRPSHFGWPAHFIEGASGRIRTCGTRFRRAVLYPLSYGGMSSLAARA